MPGGRPTSYREEYVEQARKLAELGATDLELADFFGVALSTLYAWKGRHPEFLDALKVGKQAVDERVVRSLYQRATGYSAPEVRLNVVDGELVETETVKHYPPDTAAAFIWLKNRAGWRDKLDHQVDTGDALTNLLAEIAQRGGKIGRPK